MVVSKKLNLRIFGGNIMYLHVDKSAAKKYYH